MVLPGKVACHDGMSLLDDTTWIMLATAYRSEDGFPFIRCLSDADMRLLCYLCSWIQLDLPDVDMLHGRSKQFLFALDAGQFLFAFSHASRTYGYVEQ